MLGAIPSTKRTFRSVIDVLPITQYCIIEDRTTKLKHNRADQFVRKIRQKTNEKTKRIQRHIRQKCHGIVELTGKNLWKTKSLRWIKNTLLCQFMEWYCCIMFSQSVVEAATSFLMSAVRRKLTSQIRTVNFQVCLWQKQSIYKYTQSSQNIADKCRVYLSIGTSYFFRKWSLTKHQYLRTIKTSANLRGNMPWSHSVW